AFFTATTATLGFQLYKLGDNQSVTLWTANLSPAGGFFPLDLTEFNGNVWFLGATATLAEGFQLYKLGFDGSVTKWTSINPAGGGVCVGSNPDITTMSEALWCNGLTGAGGFQLFKLGFDGSVTQWTAIPGVSLNPQDLTGFNGNEWFNGATATQGNQLYKLGFDGSVTKWTAINPGGGGLNPQNMLEFANALWFDGQTADGGQLFKLGADGSVTQWTAVPGGFDPQLVSAASSDPDSTPSSIFQNAAWLSGSNSATGTELYKLGADGSVTLWKDINPGPPSSFPHDWARLA